MNLSISQILEDFDTTVTTIQGVVTFYSLTMATLMITEGKVGEADRHQRRKPSQDPITAPTDRLVG